MSNLQQGYFGDILDGVRREVGELYASVLDRGASGAAAALASGPESVFQTILDYGLERSYLEGLSAIEEFPEPGLGAKDVGWLRINRLPIHPSHLNGCDLFSRWQGVLSGVHTWRQRLCFVLLRASAKTNLYVGTATASRGAANQLAQIAANRMPGIGTTELNDADGRKLDAAIRRFNSVGTVTGLPSLRETTASGRTRAGEQSLQTLDQLALGLRSVTGAELGYALVVIAEPVTDREIADLISGYRTLGSRIHSFVHQTLNHQESRSQNRSFALNFGALVGTALTLVPGVQFLGPLLGAFGGMYGGSGSQSGDAVTVDRLDKCAQYSEEVIDAHVKRLQRGRNLGFWNVGTYVLAENDAALAMVNGMLRTIYSGDRSYIEPIRVQQLMSKSGALDVVRCYNQIRLPNTGQGERRSPLGSLYEGVTTPLNTEELSIVTSLPHRDVPGLRFVRNAIRFASNPPPAEKMQSPITLGEIMDTGVCLSAPYQCDMDALTRHALITGTTGSGKSTTCRRLIREIVGRNVPVLIIEPAKDEYVSWAIEHNRTAPADQCFRIFMPGAQSYEGVELNSLRLNPFEPAHASGGTIDLLTHLERFSSILSASMSMTDILPVLMEEVLYEFMQAGCPDFLSGEIEPLVRYPLLKDVPLSAARVLDRRGYEERVRDNFKGCIETRIAALLRGKRGQLFNVPKSTDWDDLFDRPTVINLSLIADDRDKALVMALLATALFEYRVSRFRTDNEHRREAREGRLKHLTVIEEAHRLLEQPRAGQSNTGNPQEVVAKALSAMLSEMRSYGQGMLLVDQVPSRLITDSIKNTNMKIVHRLISKDDKQVMAWSMALRGEQEDVISVLGAGEAIICGDLDDAAAWVKIAGPSVGRD